MTPIFIWNSEVLHQAKSFSKLCKPKIASSVTFPKKKKKKKKCKKEQGFLAVSTTFFADHSGRAL
jgi:hypothetical protein